MSVRAFLTGIALTFVSVTGAAQGTPAGDPRLQDIPYVSDQIVTLRGSPGYLLTVELSPDEEVQSIAIGDSGGWQASANRKGDFLFLKPLQAGASTNMTVITNVRTYQFDLIAASSPAPDVPHRLRFVYPAKDAQALDPASEEQLGPHPTAEYRIEGHRSIRPVNVREDGKKTYLEWSSDQSLPAVFALAEDGTEMLVDGMMRNDVMVIDRVVPRLVFRVDTRVASASRLPWKHK